MTSGSAGEPFRVVNVDCYLADRSNNYAGERKAIEGLGGEFGSAGGSDGGRDHPNLRGRPGIILSEGLFSPINRRVIENLDDCWALGTLRDRRGQHRRRCRHRPRD